MSNGDPWAEEDAGKADGAPAGGAPLGTTQNVKSVSELTHEVKELIEGNLRTQWVGGEVSNCRPARSGHVYFTLKDDEAQISAVIWRTTAARLGFELRDGMEIVAVGRVEVYAARGSYQLIIQKAFPQGMGSLELALRQLKEKLEAAGLFAPARKRRIPPIPKRIALVTSPTSAAVKDMVQVITRRWPSAGIVVVPVAVQGPNAAPEIAAALGIVHLIPGVDVVITGRGGGSLEDLWAFNEEIVARAIANCQVPVISAVGHEIDVTIADLVADRRALTPSEAGELVVPHRAELTAGLNELRERLQNSLTQRAVNARLQLDSLASRRVFTNPLQRVRQLGEGVDDLSDRLNAAVRRRVERSKQEVSQLSASLNSLSPLGVLSRGYSVTYGCEVQSDDADEPSTVQRGNIIRNASDVEVGNSVLTYLEHGQVVSRVVRILAEE
ncbi:MAG: exodeoxyribonuclease VII large subunit [Planctomycetales bacterium]|jgi:exodeoxyribonuclease VII large subunit